MPMQPLKENLSISYHILSGQLPSALQPIPNARTSQGKRAATCSHFSQARTQTVPMAKEVALLARSTGRYIHGMKLPPRPHRKDHQAPKEERTSDWFTSLKPIHADAISCDSNSVKEARSHYFATHPWNWIHDNTDDLSNIFRELAEGAGLLGKSIYEIQLSWDGPEELKHANYSLQSLPKELRFLRPVPTTESPKIMGLKGIHDPDALWCFVGCTYCPWCGKEGQNEGTMVNHLRTVHYRLGLVCNLCFGCQTVTSDTLHQHGCHGCHQ